MEMEAEIYIPIHYVNKDKGLQALLLDEFYYNTPNELTWDSLAETLGQIEPDPIERDWENIKLSLDKGIVCLRTIGGDYEFVALENYCKQYSVPFNRITYPDGAEIEAPFVIFYRPGMEDRMETLIDAYLSPAVAIHSITEIINNAPEEETDTDIMLRVSEYMESHNYVSENLSIKNWVE